MCITFFCLEPYSENQKKLEENIENLVHSEEISKKQQEKSQNHKTKKIKKVHHKQRKGSNHRSSNNEIKQFSNQQGSNNSNNGTEKKGSNIKFIIAFNRDQQAERRTKKMNHFQEDPNIIAGRDSVSTGTWLGVNIKTGIMLVLTNYDLPMFRKGKSRGQLVYSFLRTEFANEDFITHPTKIDEKIKEKLCQVLQQTHQKLYPAFNLMVYNIRNDSIFYICSESDMKEPILLQKHKIYGLCNIDLFTLWPKTEHGIDIFKRTLVQIQDKEDEEILETLTEKVMKDRKRFSKNLDDEAAIFLQPFYSTIEQAERMTKTTFVALVREKRQKGQNLNEEQKSKPTLQIVMRQITHVNHQYHKRGNKHSYHTRRNKSSGQKNKADYDHSNECVVNFRFQI